MTAESRFKGRNNHLKRLPPEYYRGQSYVHWSMTIQDRKVGWLNPLFHAQFREMLAHTMLRYGMCCPVYCCMPDHIHLLWMGLFAGSDQLVTARFFRTHVNPLLELSGCRFQREPYDHVLDEEQGDRSPFEEVAEYIARNPERKQLVGSNQYREYPYLGCLVPGYPALSPREPDYWERFWNIHAQLQRSGLVRFGATDGL